MGRPSGRPFAFCGRQSGWEALSAAREHLFARRHSFPVAINTYKTFT